MRVTYKIRIDEGFHKSQSRESELLNYYYRVNY